MRSHGGFGLFRLLEPLSPQQDVPADEPQISPRQRSAAIAIRRRHVQRRFGN